MLTDIASYGLINPVPAVVEEVIGMHIYICGQDQSLGRMVITNPWAGHSSVWGRQSYMGGKGGDICEDEVYNDIPPPPLQAWEHGLQ